MTGSIEATRAPLGPFLSSASLRPVEYRPPSAWTPHTPFAMWLMAEARPAQVVELGTHHGLSFFTFCQATRDWAIDSKVWAVDSWIGDDHAGYYGPEVQAAVFDHARGYEGTAHMLPMTFDAARQLFDDGSIDLLHIDGFHTYEAVRHDFDTWLPAMSDRGVILLHDTNVRERGFGVWRLLAELSNTYPVFEFYHGFGLGVVVVGTQACSTVQELVCISEESARHVRTVYESLGQRWERLEGSVTQQARIDNLEKELSDVYQAKAIVDDRLNIIEDSTIWRLTRSYRTGFIGQLRRP